MGLKVLLVGGGGREHALAWKLSQSPLCEKLFVAPGNPLISRDGECVAIPSTDIVALKSFARQEGIDLTVVGPEAPLVAGIVDSFEASKLRIFGPSKAAARLEGSKVFTKHFMHKHHIPTAQYRCVSSREEAHEILRQMGVPVVVKADGLAEGKGSFVCRTEEEALEALRIIFSEKRFGDAGSRCVLEEFMTGEEASLFILTDGSSIIPFVGAQDHKALLDGDAGPNTGGMGSYAPAPVLTDALLDKALKDIVIPTIHGMANEGSPYRGLLYVGLMISGNTLRVVEYNCRFGDPETEPLMLLLKSDLLPLLDQVARGKIEAESGLEWHEGSAIGVVMASGGYPGAYEKKKAITGLAGVPDDVKVFGAGVSGSLQKPLTNGGRVLCVTARGKSLEQAAQKVYGAIGRVGFDGAVFRRDIGYRAMKAKA